MSIAKGWLTAGLILSAGVVCLCNGCDDDGPTRPKPVPPKDYPVYFFNTEHPSLWTFHPTTQLLDSAEIPSAGEVLQVAVSSDGSLLYLIERSRVLVVRADSLTVENEIPCDALFGATLSPDNNLLAVMGQDLHILRTSDLSVVYFDSTRVERGVFSSDSRTFFGCGIDSGNLCWVQPLDRNPTMSQKAFHSFATRIEPTPDGSKLLLGLVWHFLCYDMLADSVLFDIGVWPGPGQLAISPDGRYGFFTNPSSAFGDPGTPDIYVFDVEANRLADTIEIKPFLDSIGGWHWIGVGKMAITPDGCWMAAFDGSPTPNSLFGVDLKTRKPYYFHEFGAGHLIYDVDVQSDR